MRATALRAARLMRMDEAVWARHANPWSGWSRLSVLPLLALSLWSRVWIGWWCLAPLGLTLLWIWLNPRLFARPAANQAWMSRVVLGERIWLAAETAPIPAHHARAARWLTLGASLGAAVMAGGLALLEPVLTLTGMTASVLFKLWFGDRMVWLYEDTRRTDAPQDNTQEETQ